MSGVNERVKGITIHRPIVYGSVARLLTDEERALCKDPAHTHKWTVFVRSATAPLPSQGELSPDALLRLPGGADDLSSFIKRVTFKLHESFPSPNRNFEKPPYEVTETGWGEFPIQIRIAFVPESGEKPLALVHHLKLHHWIPAEPGQDVVEVDPVTGNVLVRPQPDEGGDAAAGTTEKGDAPAPAPPPPPPPPTGPVYAYQYDELVFTNPLSGFLTLLQAHPPTPLPPQRRRPDREEFTLQMERDETDRLEEGRRAVVRETDRWRERLIESEREVARLKRELEA